MTFEQVHSQSNNTPVSPLVSIVIANYNGGDFLKECINSVLDQTYKNFELIIIDDCSTNNDADYVASLPDTRIILYRNPVNLGQTKSLNIGLKICRGKYIARMDSDDICFSDRIYNQVEYLENNPNVFLLGGQALIIDENGEKTGEILCATNSDTIWAYSFFSNPFIHSSTMFRRELVSEHAFIYNEKYINQDFELWSRIIPRFQTSNLSCHLIKYRIHSENMTSRHFEENLKNTAKIISNRAKFERINGFDLETIFNINKYIFDSRDKADADGVDRAQLGHQLWKMAHKISKNIKSKEEFYRLIILRLFQSSLPPQGFSGIFCRINLLIKMSMHQPIIVFQVFFGICSKKVSKRLNLGTTSKYV